MSKYIELQQRKEELTHQLKEVTKTLEEFPRKEYSFESLDKEFNEYLYHLNRQPKYLLVSKRFDLWLKGIYLALFMLNKKYEYNGFPVIVTDNVVDFEWVS